MDELRGHRKRYYRERKIADAAAASPVRKDVTADARRRLVREISARAMVFDVHQIDEVTFMPDIIAEVRHVLGVDIGRGPQEACVAMAIDDFLTFLEISMDMLWNARHKPADFDALQSILADDASSFRFRRADKIRGVAFTVDEIDNAHLASEIVDRTYELTREAEFASAQHDYAEAWKNYNRGDFDGALVDAHKSFESAAKVIIKRVDPASTPDQMQTNQLVPELRRLEIIPAKLANMLNPLVQVFQNAGALRNAPGAGHGSIDLTSPEANVALLGIHLSGALVFYLAQRWESMAP